MAWVTAAAAVASTLATAGSAYMQSQAAQERAEYQAAVSRNNQIIAEQDAEAIRQRGEAEEQEHRQRIRQTLGSARARQAASGFLVNQDTNLDLQEDIAEAGEMDILKLRDDTRLRARQREIQGTNAGAQAGLFDLSASQQNPALAAGGTLLEGAASSAGAIRRASNTGTRGRSTGLGGGVRRVGAGNPGGTGVL